MKAEKLRRSRKSLHDQLRTNANNQQKEFKNKVRRKEKFNRLSKEEVEFFQKIEDEQTTKEKELRDYLNEKTLSFERKKYALSLVKQNENNHSLQFNNDTIIRKESNFEKKLESDYLKGIISKKKNPKLKIHIKRMDMPKS